MIKIKPVEEEPKADPKPVEANRSAAREQPQEAVVMEDSEQEIKVPLNRDIMEIRSVREKPKSEQAAQP